MNSENNIENSSVRIEITPQSMNSPTDDVEDTSIRVEILPQTNEMVESQMSNESDDLKQETKALIEAIRKRAVIEASSAGTLTRDTYLTAVRKAREAIESNQLIERDRIEYSWHLLQKEAEKNLESVVKEVAELGDRLTEAAKAAWEVLTAPRPRSNQ
jgi:hypothetical protein